MSETEKTLTGKRAVRAYLIEPLKRDGLQRAPKDRLVDHDAFMEKIADRLSYMRPENLDRLRAILLSCALGTSRNIWPKWATVWNFATGIQVPPDQRNPLMRSWLHSRKGVHLRDNGGLTETFLFLKGMLDGGPRFLGCPPSAYDEKQLAELARENKSRQLRVAELIKVDNASEDDRAWLKYYQRATEAALAIVDEGIAHRRAKEAEARESEAAE